MKSCLNTSSNIFLSGFSDCKITKLQENSSAFFSFFPYAKEVFLNFGHSKRTKKKEILMKTRVLRMKKCISIALMTFSLYVIGVMQGYAQNFVIDDLRYHINSDGVSVSVVGHANGNLATGSLTIPSSITYNGNTYSVTSIMDHAFIRNTKLTGSLVIPNSVTSIGSEAFYGCFGLTSFSLGNAVSSIGSDAFYGSGWYISQPEGVLYLDDWCLGYKGNKPTGTLAIQYGTRVIGPGAFTSCTDLNTIIIPNSVTTISTSAFSGCTGLTGELVIPNSVTTILAFAFSNCTGLTSVSIPSSVDQLGMGSVGGLSNPFLGCLGLEQITVDINNPSFDSRGNCNAIIETASNYLITGCKNTIIPNSVTTIGSQAFSGCTGLTGNLTIPNSVTNIVSQAFSGCSGLTGILTIPNSVTMIGDGAFSGCSGISSVNIPNSVTHIGSSVFSACTALQTITVDANNATYDSRDNCNAIIETESNRLIMGCKNTVIPNSITKIGNEAFKGCVGLTGPLTLPDGLTLIGNSAFKDCSGLSGPLTLPNSLTSIGYHAFEGCCGLTGSLSFPNSLTSISFDAFSGCSGLTGSIVIPNSVTSISRNTFKDCCHITSLTIGSSVSTIDNNAFTNCFGLEQITVEPGNSHFDSRNGCNAIIQTNNNKLILGCKNTIIPNTVTTIGYNAFKGCSGMTSITIPSSVISIESYFDMYMGFYADSPFEGCTNLAHIVVEPGNPVFDSRNGCNAIIKTESNSLYLGCKNTIIPNSVTSIEGCAFYYCSGLSSITIPESVTSIGNYAFSGCSGLHAINIPGSVNSIGKSAFSGCSGINSITIPESVNSIGSGAFTNTGWYNNQSDGILYLNNCCLGYKGTLPDILDIREGTRLIVASAFCDIRGNEGLDDIYLRFYRSLTLPTSLTSICGSFVGCIISESHYNARNYTNNLTLSPLPDYLGTLTIGNIVETIPPYMFQDKSIASPVVFPNSLTAIGEYAFKGCVGLTGSLTIPNSVTTIGEYAFEGCIGFTGNLSIGNSVTAIGECAFKDCSGFTGSLTIGKSVTSIGTNVFSGCSNFSSLAFNAVNCDDVEYGNSPFDGFSGTLSIGNEVQRIPANIFKNTGFTGPLSIPNSVTSIGNSAFYGCSGFNGSLVISNSVTEIGPSVFYNCQGFVGELVIPNSVSLLGNSSFYGCTGFSGNLTLSNSLSSIAPYTFFGCTGISSVSIPNSVLTIESNAFDGCTSLSSITLPNSLTTIGDYAFNNCRSITGSLLLPDSVTFIGANAFNNCIGLTSIVLPPSLTTIGDYAFNNCTGISGELIFPNSVTYIGAYAFTNCHGITTVSIPVSVLRIGAKAFANCSSLREIDFYAINCNIDPTWLDECSAFEILNFGNNVQYIPGYIFTDCLGLKSVNFPESLKEIGEYAFKGCKELTSLMIPDSVLVIGDYAFYDCQKLTSVIIGKSVNQIGSMVWGHCIRLTNIYYQVEKDLVSGATPFNDCPNLTTIHIDPCVLEIGSEVFRGCLTVHFIVALGNTPAILDPGAFEDIKESAIVMVSCGNKINYFSNWNMFAFDNIIEDCDYYGINVGAVGNGGNITSSAMEAQMGQEVQLTIKPNHGMGLASLKVCNANDPTQIIPVSPSGKAALTFKFTMPPFEVVVIATFKSNASVNENITASIPASVYPNPTTGFVKIEAEDLKHVTISNMFGQVFYQGKASGGIFEYDFNGSATGIYFVVIETASGITTKRVVVTR